MASRNVTGLLENISVDPCMMMKQSVE